MVAAPIVPFDVHASIQAVKQLSEIVSGLREQVFRSGHDYGVIPGTGDKPTLLLPGMEKLMRALRLRAEYHAVSITEDYDKGLFAYRYECRLIEYDTGLCVSTAIGSCNSKESKYRWRDQKRTCPKCGKETINKSKQKAEWYCWAKIGGCGATFPENDEKITSQPVGKIENPDIFDQVNTIDKIAQKRALGSAIKGAANVSEHFTVDLEDLYRFDDVVEGQVVEVVEPEKPATPKNAPANVDVETGEIKDEKPLSLFEFLFQNVDHPRYADPTAKGKAIKKLMAADLLPDGDRSGLVARVHHYATLRDDKVSENDAMAEIRKELLTALGAQEGA